MKSKEAVEKSGIKGGLDGAKLLTDRTAYLSFLESQLERVSAACLSVQGLQEAHSSTSEEVEGALEKVVNLTRVVRLTQELQEQTEQDFSKAKDQLKTRIDGVQAEINNQKEELQGLHARVNEYEHGAKSQAPLSPPSLYV